MATKQIRPTKLELSILNVLWQKGPATVREIHAIVNESKPTAVNTVLRMLQIMTEKNLVTRDDTVRPQIYRARYSQQQTQTHLVKDLHPARIRRLRQRDGHARSFHPKTVTKNSEGDGKASGRV